MEHIEVGDWVAWKWAGSIAEGCVLEVHFSRTEIVSNGSRIVRNGTSDNPAVVIKHKNGNHVLKLQSELIPAQQP